MPLDDEELGAPVPQKIRKLAPLRTGAPLWMMTYSDVITLLLTFFVLLLTFSTMTEEKFKKAAGSFRNALGVFEPPNPRNPQAEPNLSDLDVAARLRIEQGGSIDPATIGDPLASLDKIPTAFRNDGFRAERVHNGVVLRFGTNTFFDRNSDTLRKSGHSTIAKIVFMARSVPARLHVSTALYSSVREEGTELSIRRAANFAEFVAGSGIPQRRISVAGYGRVSQLDSRGDNTSLDDGWIRIAFLHETQRVP